MGFLRSEEMGYYSIVIPIDQAWEILNQLGKLSAVQFVDQNSDQAVFNRRYASYIRRCEEAERRLRFLAQEQERFKVRIEYPKDPNLVIDMIDGELKKKQLPAQTNFENLEVELEDYENSLILQLKNYEQLNSGIVYLKEKKIILTKAREAFGIEGDQYRGSIFSKIAGIIEDEDIIRFKRMIFRITRGNALTAFYEVKEPEEDVKKKSNTKKSLFFIMYQGDSAGNIANRLGRICDTIGIRRYPVPSDNIQLDEEWKRNEEEIVSSNEILDRTKQAVLGILRKLSMASGEIPCSLIEELRLFILKEKTIYHNLNMFTLKGNMFYGNCWCPKADEQKILQALSSGYLKEVEGGFPPNQKPPTYFKLNDFTTPFQSIVDTYGIPGYREANPAYFSAVTFPFLFGIMFGDIGHGLLLTLFASYLCWFKESILNANGLFKPAIPVRYLLLMMGLCATYCGFIYNDFLGIPFNFFGTGWTPRDEDGRYLKTDPDSTYPFGLDPIWYRSSNELVFFNSFKMKLAVIFGVIQMLVGNLFKGANAIHFKNKTDFVFEFIPQILFMGCIFGYMIIMIFIKWSTVWNYNFGDTAPNLITVLMNMFLKLGALDNQKPLWNDKEGQEQLQLILLLIGVFCVPLMLIPKPLIKHYLHTHSKLGLGSDYQEFQDEGHAEGAAHSLSEEFIHQMIETIEYALGAISNTASYLRLWALSLAHAQLSSVFFEKCLVSTIEMGNPIAVVVGFFFFANISVGVLMCMDALECFLHALRLHWVEFMNKFYKGDGVKFLPFSFNQVIVLSEPKK
jgi:V-type H+-transporting ATPase subunit a